jgi:hypothetical protein
MPGEDVTDMAKYFINCWFKIETFNYIHDICANNL